MLVYLVLFSAMLLSPAVADANHNDQISMAEELAAGGLKNYPEYHRVDHTNANATYTVDEPFQCGAAQYSRSVWYRFTAPKTGIAWATNDSTTFKGGLRIISAADLSAGSATAGWGGVCATTATTHAATDYAVLAAGVLYYVQVGSVYFVAGTVLTGAFTLKLAYDADSDGDRFYDRISPDNCVNEPGDITGGPEQGCPKDRDRDGHARPVANGDDCNDSDSGIHPGAPEAVNNAVDENCDGRLDYDLDGDGARVTQSGQGVTVARSDGDCNDRNPGVRPGVREIRGNRVDENCDGRPEPALRMSSGISIFYSFFPRYSTISRIGANELLAGSTVRLRCKRCSLSKRSQKVKKNGSVSLKRWFRNPRIRVGAVLEVQILPPSREWIGRTRTDRIRRGKAPSTKRRCIWFNARGSSKCPAG